MVDPAFDFDLPENLGDRFKWGPITNGGLKSIPVGYGVVDGDLVFLLKGGEEVNLGPLPPGPAGPAGGSDAATAEWIETGPETTAALSAKIGLVPGLVDDDATDNRAAIQAALDGGGTVILPKTNGRYAIAGTLTMSVPGTRFLCHGAPIRQLTDTYGVVNMYAADCEVDGLDAIGSLASPDFAGTNTSWQGSIVASRWAAISIYGNAHRARIPYVRARNMSSAIRIAGWNNLADALTTTTVDDVEIGMIVVDAVEFGIAAKATRRLKVGVAKGTYGNVTNAPRAPHLVYLADDTNLVHHWQAAIGDSLATNGVGGQAVQLKGIIGGYAASIQAEGCSGVLNLMDCSDFTVDSLLSTADTYGGVGGSITFDETTTLTRTKIRTASVAMASDGRPVRVIGGTDCGIDRLDVTVAHTTTGGATDYDVEIRGTNFTISQVNVKNTGTKAWKAVGFFGGSGHRVTTGDLLNVRAGIDVRDVSGTVVYDRDRITLHATDGYSKTISNGGAKWYARQTNFLTENPAAVSADNFAMRVSNTIAGTITGGAWTALAGVWAPDGETERTYETSGAANGAVVTETNAANVAVEVSFTSENSEGLVFRATDANNYLMARLHRTSGVVQVLKRTAGTNAVLSSGTVATIPGRRYRMRVEIYGADIKVFLDGTLVTSWTLTGGDETIFATQTKHGLRSNVSTAARFDSFRVLAL